MKVYFETLGCPKNFYDTENAKGILEDAGFEICDDPETADFVVVNTCGFINDAKTESIERIFDMASAKRDDSKLVVSGCLSKRYAEELFEEMPEADAFVGVNEYEKLPELFRRLSENPGERKVLCENGYDEVLKPLPRKLDENPYTATIKIAEGCDNVCAYCIIPFIRGGYRSKKMEDVVAEARALAGLQHDDGHQGNRGKNLNDGENEMQNVHISSKYTLPWPFLRPTASRNQFSDIANGIIPQIIGKSKGKIKKITW